jgi:hypothetical protein
MLLTTLPSAGLIGSAAFRHSARVYTPLLMTTAANVARRRMATATGSGAPVNPDKLSSKGTKEPLHQGVEGLHISTYSIPLFVFAFCFVRYGARAEQRWCRGCFTSALEYAADQRGLGSLSPSLLTGRVEGR